MSNSVQTNSELKQLMLIASQLSIDIKFSDDSPLKLKSSFGKVFDPLMKDEAHKISKPSFNQKENYFKESCSMFLMNEILIECYKDFAVKKSLMQKQINECENILEKFSSSLQKRHKNRRKNSQIKKSYTCPYQMCGKAYGSSKALNIHIRNIHSGGKKSERDFYAKKVFSALRCEKKIPKTHLSLPEDFLPRIRAEFDRLKNLGFKKEFDPNTTCRYSRRSKSSSSITPKPKKQSADEPPSKKDSSSKNSNSSSCMVIKLEQFRKNSIQVVISSDFIGKRSTMENEESSIEYEAKKTKSP